MWGRSARHTPPGACGSDPTGGARAAMPAHAAAGRRQQAQRHSGGTPPSGWSRRHPSPVLRECGAPSMRAPGAMGVTTVLRAGSFERIFSRRPCIVPLLEFGDNVIGAPARCGLGGKHRSLVGAACPIIVARARIVAGADRGSSPNYHKDGPERRSCEPGETCSLGLMSPRRSS